jgi:hypothetical protein
MCVDQWHCTVWVIWNLSMPDKQKRSTSTKKLESSYIYKTNAAIWYNKMCKQLHLTPTYFSIKMSGSNCQSHNTLKAVIQFRIKQELKYLYVNKQKLNEQLYKLQLHCATDWQKNWSFNQTNIYKKLQYYRGLTYNYCDLWYQNKIKRVHLLVWYLCWSRALQGVNVKKIIHYLYRVLAGTTTN